MLAEPPLSRAQFDRAALHRTDRAWLDEAWSRGHILPLNPSGATRATRPDGEWQLGWLNAEQAQSVDRGGPRRFLGVESGTPFFSLTIQDDPGAEVDNGAGWVSLRDIGAAAPDLDASLLATAVGLQQWHARHPRCPICGEATDEAQAGWTRICPNDGSVHFPRTDPAVIMLVHDGGDRVLLGRGAAWGPGRFSTLAGFVEPGESLESAVAREVYEEVGVAVSNITYVASQPWPFPASLMVGFTAEIEGSERIALDDDEMVEAGWFTREEVRQAGSWTDGPIEHDPTREGSALRQLPPQFSISRFLIDGWLNAKAVEAPAGERT